MANNRIFYACQAVGIQPLHTPVGGVLQERALPNSQKQFIVHGLQSVGINTSFNLEQVFELGQIQIYENIEGLPEVEVTLEKVLDGYPLMYHTATVGVLTSVNNNTQNAAKLVARSKERCDLYLGIFDESYNSIADNGTGTELQCSGMYINSISYTLPVDGNCTESVTLVGNHKAWRTPGSKLNNFRTTFPFDAVNKEDTPKNSQTGTFVGGVQRKENVAIRECVFPQSIFGVLKNSNKGNAYDSSAKTNRIHVQNVSISTDLGREDILELGSKVPYARPANFPVEVTCEIEVIAISGDLVNAYPNGEPTFAGTKNAGSNTVEESIIIKLNDGTVFDLGTKNRLSSVNYTGGDAGGGNASITYSYSTFNDFTVTAQSDPAAATNSRVNAEPFIGNATAGLNAIYQ